MDAQKLFNEADGSDDESDDEDYVPSEHGSASEEENSGDEEDALTGAHEGGDDKPSKKRKRTAKPKVEVNPRLRRGAVADPVSQELAKEVTERAEEAKAQKEKSRADSLWADFMSDVGTLPKRKVPEKASTPSSSTADTAKTSSAPVSKSVKVTQVFDFAGEQVSVEKEVSTDSKEGKAALNVDSKPSPSVKRPGGLGAVLGFINKKQKISTLDKSKLDWDKYKREASLSEELSNHTRSKNSYLEKQEFLNRTDHRQFEKERDMRLATSSKRK